ncbi:hypothetical protein [Herpetosiphon llansteffanensis]|uniref:hypothetical protein n=1 Tax=Herpetosiphon llansteffanensis TaxID=2094568 RepID=UPI000D7C1B9D|nr:hypothetical protein [Herpetosiphon llansteffanensis]
MKNQRDTMMTIGTVIVVVVAIIALIMIANIVTNIVGALVPLVTGSLLLFGNRTELMKLLRTRNMELGSLNAMVGVSLILFGAGTTLFGESFLRILFYVPAIVVLALAAPLAFGKTNTSATYRAWWNTARSKVRRKPSTPSVINTGFEPAVNNTPPSSQAPFDPMTGQRVNANPAPSPQANFDPMTGQRTVKLDPNEINNAGVRQ